MMGTIKKIAVVCFSLLPLFSEAQQTADKSFRYRIDAPAYSKGQGSTIYIDEAHQNFHQLNGRFYAFAHLLRSDGYRVKASKQQFTIKHLNSCKILVIANAIHPRNQSTWSLPVYSAFTETEITHIKQWVKNGGRLLLIADHMPFPGAAYRLAQAFGFEMSNGFAIRKNRRRGQLDRFSRKNNTLRSHVITNGRNPKEKVNELISFTGQAFQVPSNAKPLLVFPKGYENILPDTAWVFRPHTKRVPIKGWVQGATLIFGQGKVAIFGEAAMFTSQVTNRGRYKFGMSHPEAKQNPQFVLNVIRWLDGKLE